MKDDREMSAPKQISPALLANVVNALNHTVRLQIITELRHGRQYVSELARILKISRPLLYMHLERLEHAGLVTGSLELSTEGKAVKWYSLVPFELIITPELIADAASTATTKQQDNPQS